MLCVTSFTIVLTLGGGPAATTLEVAIYQALRFDFDPARAVALTLGADRADRRGGADAVAARRRSRTRCQPWRRAAPLRRGRRDRGAGQCGGWSWWRCPSWPARSLAIVVSGPCRRLVRLAGEASVQRAGLTSLVLATLSGADRGRAVARRSSPCGRALERGAARRAPLLLEQAADSGAGFVLVVPPIVIGAGWFVLAPPLRRRLPAGAVHGGRGQCRHGDAVRHPRHPAGL